MAATSSTESIPGTSKPMDPDLFNAIMKHKVDAVKEKAKQIKSQTTPNGNTALHVAAQYGNADCVKAILELCPSLLDHLNDQEETALHMAAKREDSTIAEALVEGAKPSADHNIELGVTTEWLIRKTNKNKDTALHEAVKYKRLRVVEFLVKKDPHFRYSTNKQDETPLYVAARKGFSDVALAILDKSQYGGPLGRTALHAAVASGLGDLCKKLLESPSDLATKADCEERTPLHFAAWFGRSSIVEILLKKDTECAYMRDAEGMTPLHIAAKEGHMSCISKLLQKCPDCYEMIDNKGRNALHIAAESGETIPQEVFFNYPQFRSLINEGDKNGNTPLHLLAISRKYIRDFFKTPGLDMKAVNYDHLTVKDILPPRSFISSDAVANFYTELTEVTPTRCFLAANNSKVAEKQVDDNSKVVDKPIDDSNHPSVGKSKDELKGKDELKRKYELKGKDVPKGKDDLKAILEKMSKTHVVVATLIATVTFAAGFTLPGGYNDDEGPDVGTASLVRKSAFRAFIISDTLAFMLSIFAVFAHFFRVMKIDVKFNENVCILAALFTVTAMVAMVIAYVTGTFVVLSPSLGLAIVNTVIGCFFFLFVFRFAWRWILSFSRDEIKSGSRKVGDLIMKAFGVGDETVASIRKVFQNYF